ncbi:ABC transporter ATP-binding protein [Halalkalibacillus halophilus]|uniref:ATP-binding cassette domain-containing protein n=1 Tax=Halalkalibacillus halophilus TaxID=392827 RepID=UPI000417C9E9|nr:ABC transporter ATP-binding protein [Halalkalibacillus halophilus]
MSDILTLQNVSLKYENDFSIKNINLEFETGKIYGLLGRNGAGKTSLLSLMASFQPKSGGLIKMNDENIFENPNAMQHISLIYDKDYREESTKVEQFLKFEERYRPYYDPDYADYLIKKFSLPVDQPLNKLSKGMQSTFNVIIGLASRTPLTIFDESYLGMDAPTREIFYEELLEDQANHPRIIIVSTHLVSETDHLFDEVIILHQGEILLQESYDNLLIKGTSVTGATETVDAFIQDRRIIHEKQLAGSKTAIIFERLTYDERTLAKEQGLKTGKVNLQELFTHLTKEGEKEHES